MEEKRLELSEDNRKALNDFCERHDPTAFGLTLQDVFLHGMPECKHLFHTWLTNEGYLEFRVGFLNGDAVAMYVLHCLWPDIVGYREFHDPIVTIRDINEVVRRIMEYQPKKEVK